MNGTVPILHKKPVDEPEPVRMEFRIVTEPTYDDDVLVAPPHWELIDSGTGDKVGWGPIETARAMWRIFSICSLAVAMIPVEVLEEALRAMQAQIPAAAPGVPTGAN